MEIVIGVIGTVFAILLTLLGFEKRKNKKKDEKILEQQQQIVQQKKQTEVYKINHEVSESTSTEMKEIEDAQEQVEKEIEEAETDEEIIDIANSIVSDFNRVSDRTSK